MRFADLRRNIALVSQDPVLFNDSIYHNLLLGRPEATREEVIAAARNAHAHEFITAFPQGYDTLAGERGSRLSGGQKQRAGDRPRLPAQRPDPDPGRGHQRPRQRERGGHPGGAGKLVVGKTVLIIAHRFSTIRDASLILVFDRGRSWPAARMRSSMRPTRFTARSTTASTPSRPESPRSGRRK